MMKKAFGVVDILLAIAVIGIIFALMNSKNPIVEEHQRVNVQKKQANEMVDQIQHLKEQNAVENEQLLNDLGE